MYEEARKRLTQEKQVLDCIEQRKKSQPKGKIHIISNKNSIQYYVRTNPKDKSGKYLSKKEKGRIQLYLQKRYDEIITRLVGQEIEILEQFITSHDTILNQSVDHISLSKPVEKSTYQSLIRDIYSNNPCEIKQYITPVDISDSDYIQQWISQPYSKKIIDEEKCVWKSDNGEVVRSKSELNIANMLYKMKIPYKYECPLQLYNGRIIYPDFTVLDIENRREVYWEHRGMMDDEEYARHAIRRNRDYVYSGLYLGDRLIITEETSNMPLGTNDIISIIDHYFVRKKN